MTKNKQRHITNLSYNKNVIVLEKNELHHLNDLIQKSRCSDDPFTKENLNQYMEDLRNKYHLSINDSVDLHNGEILHDK